MHSTDKPITTPDSDDDDMLLAGETATTGTDEAQTGDTPTKDAPAGVSIDGPRLTPQGRSGDDPEGEDETDPMGGAKTGQSDKAEG